MKKNNYDSKKFKMYTCLSVRLSQNSKSKDGDWFMSGLSN